MAGDAIDYAVEDTLDPDEFLGVLRRSGLADRRPVDNRPLIEKMAAGGNLVVTARHDGLLVGVARSVTDFAFCVYLSDLATDRAWQGHGIGRRLIDLTCEAAGPDATMILVSAPGAMTFYGHIGLENVGTAWVRRRGDQPPRS
jgi:GNAT superfamily N-acetyltransferase